MNDSKWIAKERSNAAIQNGIKGGALVSTQVTNPEEHVEHVTSTRKNALQKIVAKHLTKAANDSRFDLALAV